MQDVSEQQADNDSERRGNHIEGNGLSADGADFLNVLQRDDARHDREDDQGNDDHFNEIQKDRSDGLDIGIGKIRVRLQSQAAQHAENKRYKNPGSKRETLVPGLRGGGSPPLPFFVMQSYIGHDGNPLS